jgi:hypothetical protein
MDFVTSVRPVDIANASIDERGNLTIIIKGAAAHPIIIDRDALGATMDYYFGRWNVQFFIGEYLLNTKRKEVKFWKYSYEYEPHDREMYGCNGVDYEEDEEDEEDDTLEEEEVQKPTSESGESDALFGFF